MVNYMFLEQVTEGELGRSADLMSHTRSGHHRGDKLTVIFTIIMDEVRDREGRGAGGDVKRLFL